ncbi:MAG: esterase [Leptospiraceae bacterium]|nr:esterase [Leptospiraceae bacterium]
MQTGITQRKIGNLNCYEVKGKEGGPVTVLMHGFGANAQDLLPLHQYIKAPSGTNWYFPDAPMEMDMGAGFQGRAWFPLMASAIDHVAKYGMNFANLHPPGLDKANEEIMKMLEDLKTPMEKITLGGFSQGSMLATDVTLRLTENTNGLIILSGTLICQSEWSVLAKNKSKIQFFQSHGTEDPVLIYQNGKNLEALLRENGMSGEFVSFNGGHEIPDKVLKRLSQYLLR